MKLVFLGAANPETGRMIRALERSQPDFKAVGFIDNDPNKKGSQFLGLPVTNLLQARESLYHPAARFLSGGRLYEVRVSIKEVSE